MRPTHSIYDTSRIAKNEAIRGQTFPGSWGRAIVANQYADTKVHQSSPIAVVNIVRRGTHKNVNVNSERVCVRADIR